MKALGLEPRTYGLKVFPTGYAKFRRLYVSIQALIVYRIHM